MSEPICCLERRRCLEATFDLVEQLTQVDVGRRLGAVIFRRLRFSAYFRPMKDECPGCGLSLDVVEGPVHAYLGASPACWDLFGQVLAREFSDSRLMTVHDLTVDTYAVQHPGVPERRTIQSVTVHLVRLYLTLERGLPRETATSAMSRFTHDPKYVWLEPPQPNGTITVVEVLDAETVEAHQKIVREWAEDVWLAWAPHHDHIRSLVDA